MWRKHGVAAGLVGGAVEQSEHIRRDHGGRSLWLGAWLRDHCRQGFDLPEAEHLCRRFYCRFGGIPMALRAQLSRATLAPPFAELARLGWIRTVGGIGQFALDPEHWRNLLTPDYRRVGSVCDQVLGDTVFHRLQPDLG